MSGEVILYQTADGQTRVQCRFFDNSLWLSQALIAELFQVTVPRVNEHLKGIYADRELPSDATIRKFRMVRREGTREVARDIEHYNLEAILAVGYRVRSQRGTQFRQWATARLHEYLVKGFVLDDERLKNPPGTGVPDYFDELLERIRDIRASERRMYLRVREILALAADYDPKDEEAQLFFRTAQNKLHFAVTGKTAPEYDRESVAIEFANELGLSLDGDRLHAFGMNTPNTVYTGASFRCEWRGYQCFAQVDEEQVDAGISLTLDICQRHGSRDSRLLTPPLPSVATARRAMEMPS